MKYQSLNPTTEEVLREFTTLSTQEALESLTEAETAYHIWKNKPLSDRLKPVEQLAHLLEKNQMALAHEITLEMGKPLHEAEKEIEKSISGCIYYIRNAGILLKPEIIPTTAAKSYVCFDPLGVILGVMPWNFPVWQVLRFAIPTLISGNTVLIKPAPNVPASALLLQKIFKEAGFPEGVLQTLLISNETASILIADRRLKGISLTGSSKAGREIAGLAGQHLKKTVLELGGSDPFIVLGDANLNRIIPEAIRARMINAGQSCISAKRFIVHKDKYKKFKSEFSEALNDLMVGNPLDPQTHVGPLARHDLRENLEKQIRRSIEQGAALTTHKHLLPKKGFFYKPSLLSEVTEKMIPFEEEIFGPVASLILAESDEHAIELANKTDYGLGGSLWSENVEYAEKLARQIEAGSVFINGMVRSNPTLPFGGIKNSGYGRELAGYGLKEFVNVKTIWIE